MSHYAIIRDDRGALQVRRFATAADAAAVSCERELPAPAPLPRTQLPAPLDIAAIAGRDASTMRHSEFARRLGIHPDTVRRAWKAGGLPGAIEQTQRTLLVPCRLLRLAKAYGFMPVTRMGRAGLL
jgi:hypothetical protein